MGSRRLTKTALHGTLSESSHPCFHALFAPWRSLPSHCSFKPSGLTSMQQEKMGSSLHRAYQSHLHLPDTEPKANRGTGLLALERSPPAYMYC